HNSRARRLRSVWCSRNRVFVWKNVVESVRALSTNCTTLCCRDFSVHPCCSTRRWNKRLPIRLVSPRLAALCAWSIGPLMKAALLYMGFTWPQLWATSLEEAFSDLWDEVTPGAGIQLRMFVQGNPRALKPAIQQ